MATAKALDFEKLAPRHMSALAKLFDRILERGEDRFFHPHPFTFAEAERLCRLETRDYYGIILCEGEAAGYGMLRGWDEGYRTPSLGIVIDSAYRGIGLGRCYMNYLHTIAKLNGAATVRLKVYPENLSARRLYESMGYRFGPTAETQLLGLLDLATNPTRSAA